MKHYWTGLFNRIEAMHLRERILILVLAIATLIMLFANLLVDTQLKERHAQDELLSQNTLKISLLQLQIRQKMDLQAIDPDASNRVRLRALEQRNTQLRNTLALIEKELIPPEKIPAFLENILNGSNALRIVAVRSLPPEQLNNAAMATVNPANSSTVKNSAAPAQAGAASTATGNKTDIGEEKMSGLAIYKHAIEVTVEGSYPDLLTYVKSLETGHRQLFWEKMTLTVQDYPRTTLSLVLFSLSLDKKWMTL